jgi:hypothetical protein
VSGRADADGQVARHRWVVVEGKEREVKVDTPKIISRIWFSVTNSKHGPSFHYIGRVISL